MLEVHRLVGPPAGAPGGVETLYVTNPQSGVITRRCFRAHPGQTLALDTYVNGLPVAYWREVARARSLQLRARVRGDGAVVVKVRDDAGAVREVARQVVGRRTCMIVADCMITEGARWAWVELEAGPAGLEVRDAAWWLPTDTTAPRVGVGITTYNRPADCVTALQAISDEPGGVARVVVVDQGEDLVEHDPRLPGLLAGPGPRIDVLRQPNLGGSGGFTRAIRELLADPGIDQVLLLDDDVVVEPEAIRRLAVLAAAAPAPVVAGGQMLKLTEPTVLHSTAESVERLRFWWGPAPGAATDLQLADRPAGELDALTRLADVDYTGWWMCLLPRAVLERVGLPLPLFIKWDDVEYGLRAREHGVPVVTLPGAAVWHMPWTVKDTSRDWQAFYLARNRLVAAALHGGRWPLGVLLHLAAQTLGHLVSMAYSAAELTQAGVEEFARGPRRLHETQREGPALPHRLRAGYVDADAAAAASVRPVAGDTPRAVGRTGGRGVVTGARALARALLGATGAADTEHQPLTRLPLADARWSVLYRLDRVLVTSPDGRPSSLRVRDRALARRLAARTGRNVVRVLLAWPRLRRQYRQALPELSSPAGWAHLLPPGPT